MCRGQSLGLLGTSRSSCRSPRPANLLQLGVDFPLGTGGDQRDHGVENLQPPLDFAFAHTADAAMIVRHSLADDLAFRLGKDFGGILDAMNRLRVQREGDFVGCHTYTIPLPYWTGKTGTPDTVTNTRCRRSPAKGRDLAAELPM